MQSLMHCFITSLISVLSTYLNETESPWIAQLPNTSLDPLYWALLLTTPFFKFSSLLLIDNFWCFLIFLLVTILKRHLPSSPLYPIPILVSSSTPVNTFSSSPLTSYLYTSGCIFPFFCTSITGIFTAIPINSLDPNPTCLCPYLVYGHSSKHLGVFLHSAPFYLPFISFSYHLNFQKCSKFLLSLTINNLI